MPPIYDVERQQVGIVRPSALRQDGFEFADTEGKSGIIEGLFEHPEKPELLVGRLEVYENGDMIDSKEVVLGKEPVVPSRPYRVFLHEHKKGMVRGAEIAFGAIAVGSLFVHRKNKG